MGVIFQVSRDLGFGVWGLGFRDEDFGCENLGEFQDSDLIAAFALGSSSVSNRVRVC